MSKLKLKDGEPLYYETHGKGPTLLLVAGLGGVGSFWQRHVEAFARRFTAHDYSIDQMADDVLALMDGLGIASAHFVGHSTGGAIGQVLAIDHPSRIDRLVLSATFTAADPYFRRLFEVRAGVLG